MEIETDLGAELGGNGNTLGSLEWFSDPMLRQCLLEYLLNTH